MERGEIPREMTRDLGYSERDLERFMSQLEERLADPGLDQSADVQAARRQFDSLLKGIQYDSAGQMRGGGQRERAASQSSGTDRRFVPPVYRLDMEAYQQKLSQEPARD
jgi:hypothetical protein